MIRPGALCAPGAAFWYVGSPSALTVTTKSRGLYWRLMMLRIETTIASTMPCSTPIAQTTMAVRMAM